MEEPCLSILSAGDKLISVLKGPYSHITDELDYLAEAGKYYYDNEGDLLFFYTYDEILEKELVSFCQWQWLCDLVKPDYTDLYHELYQYFHQQPESFLRLPHRDFEILMSELLRNKGKNFQTILESGRDDRGIDIILIDRNGIVPSFSLVQVKRQKAPIKLAAVSALLGTLEDMDHDKGLFITSSRFLPGVAEFAGRQKHRMIELADRNKIANWSFDATAEIENCIKQYTNRDYISHLFQIAPQDLTGRILVTTVADPFKDTFQPEFVMVLRDTKYLSLVMQLPTRVASGQRFSAGAEIPEKTFDLYDRESVGKIIFRVRKEFDKGKVFFRGRRRIYSLWDDQPEAFLRD